VIAFPLPSVDLLIFPSKFDATVENDREKSARSQPQFSFALNPHSEQFSDGELVVKRSRAWCFMVLLSRP
jgi:hypothetical protein